MVAAERKRGKVSESRDGTRRREDERSPPAETKELKATGEGRITQRRTAPKTAKTVTALGRREKNK